MKFKSTNDLSADWVGSSLGYKLAEYMSVMKCSAARKGMSLRLIGMLWRRMENEGGGEWIMVSWGEKRMLV